jgi:NAD(P)-dependent dehydrogenase (short-subunit alcohol dehydrogenase family)
VFAEQGSDLALLSRTPDGSAAAMQAAKAAHPQGKHRFYATDASQPEQVEHSLRTAAADLGAIDILIYNARGGLTFGPPLDVSYQELRQTFDLEVTGALAASKAVVPAMIAAGGGTVIFSSATAAIRGSARNLTYAVAKFGLRALSQSLAKAYASKGVHFAHVRLDCALDVPVVRKMMGANYKKERTADPDDVARAYLDIHRQPRSAWSNEIELRPYTEEWTC